MKSLLFIGVKYHTKTCSADFFLSIISEWYNITFCYIDLFSEDPYSATEAIEQKDFEVMVCWQVMPPRKQLDRLFRYKHGVFIPMYDACPKVKKVEKWFSYRDYNIICFSKTLANQLKKAGFSAHYIQFFPKPIDFPINLGNNDSAFMWFRRDEINQNIVEKLFFNIRLKHLHIHNAPDPGNILVSSDAGLGMKMTYSTWYADKNKMLEDVNSCSYYIAPRPEEGIGMSFLEAMAMGKCVVAPNSPTMNEYIIHGETGLLYNLKKPKPFSIIDVYSIQQNTLNFMKNGYRRWDKEKIKVYEWMHSSVEISYFKMSLYMIIRFIKNPIKVIRVLKDSYF